MRKPSEHIDRLQQRFLFYRIVEICLISTGVAFVLFSLATIWSNSDFIKSLLSIFAGVLNFTVLALHYRLFNIKSSDFIRFLNQRYPTLQQSADLLIKEDEQLNSLERIQKEKTATEFNRIYPEMKLPHHLVQSSLIFAACVGFSFSLSSFVPTLSKSTTRENNNQLRPESIKQIPASIQSFEIKITPPDYTNLPVVSSKSFELSLPEGSKVSWRIHFQGDVKEVKFIFSNRDSSVLENSQGDFRFEKKLQQSGFYQMKWKDETKTQWSDFFRIEVIKDELPKISITNLNQFTRLKYSDAQDVKVISQLNDDYSLIDADIIATVSKGSGEGIKFREERLRFASPSFIRGKQIKAETTLNLKKLGLEPGDELYFYVQAIDNKMPKPNRSRTETFFVALQDTTKNEAVEDEGLGVDLMPDYFRSQRQIIIDTEKLLKDKSSISKHQFNATSNELGFDQKTLRLKYGQFLGEEEDSGIATDVATPHEDDEKDEDITKQFSHQHDKGNEHNLVQEKKPGHDHKEELIDPDKKEDPLAAFVHSHDNTEVATFFEQSLRAKLKAALTVMWDAELYLRLYEPEKSLPYQYTALKLLKEISNDSRIYVHRTGFDPPPLKEEKRLAADLSEVRNSSSKLKSKDENEFQNIREALLLTEKLLQNSDDKILPAMQTTFQRAGQEFSSIAVEKPSLLPGLSLLKKFAENQIESDNFKNDVQQLKKYLWLALPEKSSSPTQHTISSNKLSQLFIQQLEENGNE